jgi:16S rRNA G1207 methylase RsmC
LLRKAPIPGAETRGALLDLGCGYGPIACVLAASAPRATVYAVDVNARALELARLNGAEYGVIAARPDEVPADVRFREIWSNPPIRVGKAELHGLLARWLPRMEPGGRAWLVVAKHLGSDSLADWLREQGWRVDKQASQQGFRVLRVTEKSHDDTEPLRTP